MSNINTNLNIKTRVRLYVLYDIIKNLSESFGFPKTIEETLQKGIKEKQILSSVYAYYLDDNEKAVGKVSFEIDWQTYEMYASTESGSEIMIDDKIPLVDQFANWASDIIKYVTEMREKLGVNDIKVYYRYRPEIRNDAIKDKEADEFLGLGKSDQKIEFNNEKVENFARQMTYVSEMLPELKINIQSKWWQENRLLFKIKNVLIVVGRCSILT